MYMVDREIRYIDRQQYRDAGRYKRMILLYKKLDRLYEGNDAKQSS